MLVPLLKEISLGEFNVSNKPLRTEHAVGVVPRWRTPAAGLSKELGMGRGPDQESHCVDLESVPGRCLDDAEHGRSR